MVAKGAHWQLQPCSGRGQTDETLGKTNCPLRWSISVRNEMMIAAPPRIGRKRAKIGPCKGKVWQIARARGLDKGRPKCSRSGSGLSGVRPKVWSTPRPAWPNSANLGRIAGPRLGVRVVSENRPKVDARRSNKCAMGLLCTDLV